MKGKTHREIPAGRKRSLIRLVFDLLSLSAHDGGGIGELGVVLAGAVTQRVALSAPFRSS